MSASQPLDVNSRAAPDGSVPFAPPHPAMDPGVSLRGQTLAATGGLLGALAASSCCILPVVLFSLGISGAWIGNFTRLAPYKPAFIAVTMAFLGLGYFLVHRASQRTCGDDEACARPLPNKLVRVMLVAATVLVAAAFSFDFVAPLLLS